MEQEQDGRDREESGESGEQRRDARRPREHDGGDQDSDEIDRDVLWRDRLPVAGHRIEPALLRAVQFGEIRPVGSDVVRKVDVRVIAATHRDLHAMIQSERFREDLYYRLAVLEVRVPPLRERTEDIGELARLFLGQQNARNGRTLMLSPSAVGRLERHPWPGNVRELENVIVRLSVLAAGPELNAADVDEFAIGSRPQAQSGPLPTLSLRELEKTAIQEAMRRFDGNKRKAAEALGVALKTLYNKLNASDGAEDADEPEAQ